MTTTRTYTISELAREFGITPRAIRFYEDRQLLSPLRIGQARIYSKSDRARLKLTLRGKRLGLSLAEIKELIDMYRGIRNDASQLQQFLRVLAARRAALAQQREDIEAVLDEIGILEKQCVDLLDHDIAGAAEAQAELNKRIDSDA